MFSIQYAKGSYTLSVGGESLKGTERDALGFLLSMGMPEDAIVESLAAISARGKHGFALAAHGEVYSIIDMDEHRLICTEDDIEATDLLRCEFGRTGAEAVVILAAAEGSPLSDREIEELEAESREFVAEELKCSARLVA